MQTFSNSGRRLPIGAKAVIFTNVRPAPDEEIEIIDTRYNVLNVAQVTSVVSNPYDKERAQLALNVQIIA